MISHVIAIKCVMIKLYIKIEQSFSCRTHPTNTFDVLFKQIHKHRIGSNKEDLWLNTSAKKMKLSMRLRIYLQMSIQTILINENIEIKRKKNPAISLSRKKSYKRKPQWFRRRSNKKKKTTLMKYSILKSW